MSTPIETPPLDDAELRQWRGLLEIYQRWLGLFAQGSGDVVEAEIAARAAYCRQEIERAERAVR